MFSQTRLRLDYNARLPYDGFRLNQRAGADLYAVWCGIMIIVALGKARECRILDCHNRGFVVESMLTKIDVVLVMFHGAVFLHSAPSPTPIQYTIKLIVSTRIKMKS